MEGRNISIFAFIQNEKDEVLLVLNKEEERQDGGFTKPAGWGLPGGHVKANEKDIDGLVREIREETGIQPEDIEVDLFECYSEKKQNREPGGGIHLVMVMRVSLKVPSEKITLQPSAITDVEEARWFKTNQLPDNLYRSHRKRIERFLAKQN